MSAPMLSGLYSRLKDRSLSCTDRLKLARFGWKTPAVFVPNKEQVILDWLTGLLVNKKKFGLNDSDVEQVWATLHDILQTKKYARKTNISIKNSFTSVLAEYITHYGTRDVSVGSLASVLRCCHVILTSTTMSTLFTTKFDALVALVAALLNTAAHQLRVGTTTSEQLRSILTFVLPKFTTLATKQINQRQVLTWLTDKLLTPSLYVIRRMGRHGDGGRESSAVRTLLQQLVDSLLLHDDHAHSYLVFLSARYVAEATKLQPPKHVDHAMQCLVSGVRCGAGDDRDAIIDYLPLFLEAFMKSYGDAEASAGFRMLRYLWEAVELTGDAECRLAASAELLGVAHACAVFGQAIDDAGREDERCWMEERVTSLLACDGDAHGSAAWGRCMLQLLRVDHTVVEARVVTVMDACLTPHSECGDAVLTALLDTYARMRRLDKFTLKLLAAVRGNARQGAWRFPRAFMGSFGDVVTTSAPSVVLDVWKQLNDELTRYARDVEDAEAATAAVVTAMWGVCSLLCHLLLHARLADASVPAHVTAQMIDMLSATYRPVLSGLHALADQHAELQSHWLLLHYGWQELTSLLAFYGKLQGSDAAWDVATTDARIDNLTERAPPTPSLYYVTRLLVQRLRLSLLGCGEAAIATLSDRAARVVNIVHESLSPATMATADATSDGCWDEQLYTVTSANQALAQWRLLCDNLPLLIVGLSRHAEGATGVCDLLVQTTVDDDVTATADKCVTSPRAVVAVRALQDASLYELAGFQRHIMAAAWRRVRDDATSLVAGSKTCSRKLRDIFDKLQILAGDDREGGDDSSSRVALSEVATLLVEFQTRAASRAGRLSVGMETPAGCRAWQGISTLLGSLQVALLSETHLTCCFVAAAVALICLPTCENKEASLLGRFTSLMEQTLDLGRPCELLRRSVPEEFFENMRSYVEAEEYPRLTRFLVKLSMGKAPPGERDGGSTQDSVVQFARRVYTCSPDELRSIVSDLLQQTMQKDAFLSSLPLWEQLLTRHLADAKQKTLLPLLVHVVIATQGLCGSDDPAVICAALHLQTLVLRSTKGVLNFGKTAVLCLHSVARVALADVVAPSSQPPVINAIYELLHELIASHAEGALHAIPSYVHATKKMLFGIMHAGKQTGEPGGQRSAASNEVILCANNVDRLTSAMVEHKREFSKVAPYIVADYIAELQKLTMYPDVKKAVVRGMYQVLDMCDSHAVAMLHAALGPAGGVVFRTLYDEFVKYHKYTGKV